MSLTIKEFADIIKMGFCSPMLDTFSKKWYCIKSRLNHEDDLLAQFHGADEAGEDRVPDPDGGSSMKYTTANSKTNPKRRETAVTDK